MEYIPNDIDLTETNGNLLYGINASGKSSTMKSLGIALICAQAGLYVPAKFFKFRPFNSLFTRVSSGDNIF